MIFFEVCCGSAMDAIAAENGGASRIELNSALSLGGLTPDIGSLLICKEKLKIPVIAMLRPRGGGFCYKTQEYEAMYKSAEILLQSGADGLAFGFLQEDRTVDVKRATEITKLIHSYGKEAVFHRAFDLVRDFDEAIEQLISIGIDRILTSGGESTALEGAGCLAHLEAQYGSKIEILAGSGVRCGNVRQLLEKTGVHQIHSSCRGFCEDKTARGNGVSFSYEGLPEWLCFETVSEAQVRELKQEILQFII